MSHDKYTILGSVAVEAMHLFFAQFRPHYDNRERFVSVKILSTYICTQKSWKDKGK